jgi:hypothetical protein
LYSIYARYLLSILDVSQVTRRVELMYKLYQLALWYQLYPSSSRHYMHRNIRLNCAGSCRSWPMASHYRGLGSLPVQSTWDLWWMKWH